LEKRGGKSEFTQGGGGNSYGCFLKGSKGIQGGKKRKENENGDSESGKGGRLVKGWKKETFEPEGSSNRRRGEGEATSEGGGGLPSPREIKRGAKRKKEPKVGANGEGF